LREELGLRRPKMTSSDEIHYPRIRLATRKTYRFVTSALYLLIAVCMLAASATIVLWAGWNAIAHFSMGEAWIDEILTSISALIVSLAIVEIANHLFEEEMFKSSGLKTPSESRKTLTKISVIIIIAINLEALVYVFKSGRFDLSSLIFPAALFASSGLVMLFLGIFQRISIGAEFLDRERQKEDTASPSNATIEDHREES
jgi:hypothetical protein